jgi:hypothetical protein
MSLVITKRKLFFSLQLDAGFCIISEQNRLLTTGDFANFKPQMVLILNKIYYLAILLLLQVLPRAYIYK